MSFKKIKQYRLPGFNYASNDAYFVTAGREHFFGKIANQEMIYSEIGKIAVNEILMAKEHKQNILIPDFIVMPNHVHIVLGLQNEVIHEKPEVIDKSLLIPGEIHSLQKGSLPAFGNRYKGRLTRAAKEQGIIDFAWQPKYHDRIIRDRSEYLRISEYLANNVANWDEDSENNE